MDQKRKTLIFDGLDHNLNFQDNENKQQNHLLPYLLSFCIIISTFVQADRIPTSTLHYFKNISAVKYKVSIALSFKSKGDSWEQHHAEVFEAHPV